MVFHFNTKHLQDPTVPMWVVKTKGETYYVTHVVCERPWSTKETPDNSHTKGSLKIKKCLLTIDDDNTAHLTELFPEDIERLKTPEKIIRIITDDKAGLNKALQHVSKHGEIKTIGGACTTTFYMTDLYSDEDVVMLKLVWSNFRELKPNEHMYKMYDKSDDDGYIDEDEYNFNREDHYEFDDLPSRSATLKKKMLSWFT